MVDAFAVEITVRRFTWWRSALALLALAAIGSEAAWVQSRSGWSLPLQWLAGGGGALAIVVVIASLWTPRRGLLSCRDGRWYFQADPVAASMAAPVPAAAATPDGAVELEVAIDLGSFLLLRLQPLPSGEPEDRRRWLPLQRRGLEDRWQALRCAVYRPRQAPGPASASSGAAEVTP